MAKLTRPQKRNDKAFVCYRYKLEFRFVVGPSGSIKDVHQRTSSWNSSVTRIKNELVRHLYSKQWLGGLRVATVKHI